MFSQKDGELHADDIDDSEHVGKGHVGDEQEKGSIDAHNSFLSKLLPKIDSTKNKSNDLTS